MYRVELKKAPIEVRGNRGQRVEVDARYTLTGEVSPSKGGHADRYDLTSDLEGLRCSVKSPKFTLMNASLCVAQDKDGIIAEYFERTHSTEWAYVATDGYIYMMNADEFRKMLQLFCGLSCESNSPRLKVKHSAVKASEQWLRTQL